MAQIVISLTNGKALQHEVSDETAASFSNMQPYQSRLSFYDIDGDVIIVYLNHVTQLRIKP